MIENQETIDFETYRLFAMYADGVQVADIATSFSVTTGTIYKRLNEFPKKYAEAKKQLAKKRNAKYRRIGALASDIQLNTLEHYRSLLEQEDELAAKQIGLIREICELKKSETKDSDSVQAELSQKKTELYLLEIQLNRISAIRDKIKDISTVGENAERRADLNEGKATDRIVNVGIEPTKEEWEEFWKAQKEAGNGLDTESIQT